ncbi:hypothetical protein LTR96_011626 [Exophiala xenobiotica]|uniref:Uncharacterized protein n=1 Tax=Exophiala oligosperma TaxID=215243 RepID=A0A0D2DJC6_9EURO|nr:uncharacterized protein PV06_11835 [Exophiala oligosperma]KAK5202588.1 hypothetical protein LTR41_011662 [Exophiala xenobiotica]KAK5215061.1 hypothetical protein LTR72_011859 [Exophiala xenobiotica]KAK5218137.1 hypothetical protein LTR47_011766 [Exophiala xenobiotica]KAK5242440.1 hypothetical protein LTS06_011523 [Exophiala xenobiotica]KAK5262920.1 hypothetical protein LTR96_011626 [Exophiala xenobiotica]
MVDLEVSSEDVERLQLDQMAACYRWLPTVRYTYYDPDLIANTAEKVLYRKKVSTIARQLQITLAFAFFKVQHGCEDRTFSSIEPEFIEKIWQQTTAECALTDDEDDYRYSPQKWANPTFKVPPLPARDAPNR